MLRQLRLGIATMACLAGCASAIATPAAVVDAIQSPVWLERDGHSIPAQPGMVLQNRDRLLTGDNARAIIQLGDGSAVKLGANSQTEINALSQKSGGLFTAALDVSRGAFRLTTDILRKLQGQRAINVRVGTVTAGIRGTDLWGSSGRESDFVCLLEGRIFVSHPLGEGAELTEPLQYYAADKGKAPEPVAFVSEDQVRRWAALTELQSDAPTLRAGGAWAVVAARTDTEEAALALYDQLRTAGHPVRIVPLRIKGSYVYELLIGPVGERHDAEVLAERINAFTGSSGQVVRRGQAALRPR